MGKLLYRWSYALGIFWLLGALTRADAATVETLPNEWQILDKLPFSDGCGARKAGDEIDTILIVNRTNQLILVAAKPNWNHQAGSAEVTLQIDDSAPETMRASTIANLSLVLVADNAKEAQLRQAKLLRWHLPWGDFRTTVTGLGDALDALRQCVKSKIGG